MIILIESAILCAFFTLMVFIMSRKPINVRKNEYERVLTMTIEKYNEIPEGARLVREAVFKDEQGFVNEFDDIDRTAMHFSDE